MVEILGRETTILPMVLGEHVLLGVTVLEELDLMVDCKRNQLVPYQGRPISRLSRLKITRQGNGVTILRRDIVRISL